MFVFEFFTKRVDFPCILTEIFDNITCFHPPENYMIYLCYGLFRSSAGSRIFATFKETAVHVIPAHES